MTVCQRCKGKGYVLDRMMAIFTWGIVPMMEWLMLRKPCPECQDDE